MAPRIRGEPRTLQNGTRVDNRQGLLFARGRRQLDRIRLYSSDCGFPEGDRLLATPMVVDYHLSLHFWGKPVNSRKIRRKCAGTVS